MPKTKEEILAAGRVRNQRERDVARAFVAELRARTRCAQCGKPMADWHNPEHVAKPVRRIARMVGIGRKVEAIQAEIDSCVALCRRCHMAEDKRLLRLREVQPPSQGEANPNARLTWADVRAIRDAGQTESLGTLAAQFGVKPQNVAMILKNRIWTDPNYQPPHHKHRIDGRTRRAPAARILKGNFKKRITHCPKGHPYDEPNTYIRNGHRYCRTCHREQIHARKKALT